MVTEAQKRAQKKYDSKNCIHAGVKLNRSSDADIIKWLSENKGNKQGAIKRAIRFYLNNKTAD